MFSDEKVRISEVLADSPIVAEYLEYLRWLAEEHPDCVLNATTAWKLYEYGVREARVWSEVCEELNLPLHEGWA